MKSHKRRTRQVVNTEVRLTDVWRVVFWVGCEGEAGFDLHAKKKGQMVINKNIHYGFKCGKLTNIALYGRS